MGVRKAARRLVAISALSLLLAACSVNRPATLSPSTYNLQTATSVEFAPTEQPSSLRGRWSAALGRAFSAKSVSVQTGAPFIADFALSIRKAGTGIAAATDNADEIDWESAPRTKRVLDILEKCPPQRLRGTLVIFRRSNGEIVYRGESEADGCDFDDSDIADMASQLVDDAIN